MASFYLQILFAAIPLLPLMEDLIQILKGTFVQKSRIEEAQLIVSEDVVVWHHTIVLDLVSCPFLP